METKVKNANAVQGTAAKTTEAANKTANRPSLTQKEAKQDEKHNHESAPAKTPEVETGKAATVQAGSTATVDNKPADAENRPVGQALIEAHKADAPKAEAAGHSKPALNLEQTLKSVSELHRLTIQRLALIARIKTLEDFEIKLAEEGDELSSNPYEGCKLIIEDDKRRQFVTNTPNLIRMVSQYIFDACNDKLTEIEANIIFPNA